MNFLKSITHLAGFVAISFILIACGGGGGGSKAPANDDPVVEDPIDADDHFNDPKIAAIRGDSTRWEARIVPYGVTPVIPEIPVDYNVTSETVVQPHLVDIDTLTVCMSIKYVPNYALPPSDVTLYLGSPYPVPVGFAVTYLPPEGIIVDYTIPIEQLIKKWDQSGRDLIFGAETGGWLTFKRQPFGLTVWQYDETGKVRNTDLGWRNLQYTAQLHQVVGQINLNDEIKRLQSNG